MRSFIPLLAAVSFIAILAVWGCLPTLKTLKTDVAPKSDSKSTPSVAKDQSLGPPTSPDHSAPLVSPPPSASASPQAAEVTVDLRQRAEINQAALDFAKHLNRVKYVKTCWSKTDGEWYLHIYLDEGKKVSLQQFIWRPKLKEWEPIFQMKEVPQSQLDFHLKSELDGEKCFLLKK